jgi:hypothetical protein
MISQNLIVNEGQTEGVGDDHDHVGGCLPSDGSATYVRRPYTDLMLPKGVPGLT